MPDGWNARSVAAALAVAGGSAPDDHSAVWRDLKPYMLELSDHKCWYCESPVDRDDNAVDHYRPKNRVFEAPQHSGYRWLAFEKSNFRLACTYCNSRRIDVQCDTAGGKADRFPLLDESRRVYSLGPVDDEGPELLDPCIFSDCELIVCRQENGKPCCATGDLTDIKRVETSIEVYHLDRESTCKRRHTIVVTMISDIMEAKDLFILSESDESRKKDFLKVAQRILSVISKDSPYSGEMRGLLRSQRSANHPWVQQLLEA